MLVIATSDAVYKEIMEQISHSAVYGKNKDKVCRSFDVPGTRGYLWKEMHGNVPIHSCIVENDLLYAGAGTDDVIMREMFIMRRNWQESMLTAFFKLAEKFYDQSVQDNRGIFIDIGAHIGTTSIYAKTKINKELRVIGFEAWEKNYDFFRINCILNHVEDITVENLALSNSNEVKYFITDCRNTGNGHVSLDKMTKNIVHTVTLDWYLKQQKIDEQEISYIWMDTEGHESEIVEGAMETLKKKKIPLIQEFNAGKYKQKNMFDDYCRNINSIYEQFIDMNEYLQGIEKSYSTSDLQAFACELERRGIEETDLFFY